MRFSDQFLDDIRERLPISSVVGEYVAWDKRKSRPAQGDFWACCPFHSEKTPSFHADDRRGRYHCFGCGVSGDHFRFLTDKAGLSFPEAVETLAGRAGLPMPARDARTEETDRQRATLVEAMELAATYFAEALAANAGARARGYLNERGVPPALQQKFRLGYAPGARNGLKEYLAQNRVSAETMEAAGLVITGEDVAVPFDRFRNRLMFPITDRRERVIAFGGRAMGDDVEPKYLNSPETPLFAKRRTLYNAAAAAAAVRDGKPLIVVEGYMDVIALAGAGIGGALAPLGTALTEEHLGQLWRISEVPVMCFDGDEAGARAASRVIDMALPMLRPGHSLGFVTLPEGTDPDDFVRQHGASSFAGLVDGATPLAAAVWARETRGTVFETPEARAALEQRLKQIAGTVDDASVRRHYQQEFEQRVGAFFRPAESFGGGTGWRGRGPGGRGPGGRGPGGQGERWRGERWRGPGSPRYVVSEGLRNSRAMKQHGSVAIDAQEAAIAVSLVNYPGLADDRMDALAALDLASAEPRKLLAALLDAIGEGAADAAAVREAMVARGLGESLAAMEKLLARQGVWQALANADRGDAETGLSHALALHNKKVQLNRELKAAEIALGDDPSEEAFERLRDIQNQISSVEGTEALIEGFGSLSGRTVRNL